ncbi:MAG: response regulator transcription factor [Chloroflexi bacterium]|nr:response regulator transcription factor [Chloroflexota bacterium]
MGTKELRYRVVGLHPGGQPAQEQLKRTTILLADDHPLMRQALKALLEKEAEFQVIGEASDGDEAVELAMALHPDVVIMDISMPKINGLEATRRIKAKSPATAVLVLTIHGDSDHVLGILEAGAAGYLTKAVFGQEIVQSIRAVTAGETVLEPAIARQVLRNARSLMTKPIPLEAGGKLTGREIQVLNLAARGMSNKDIALALGLSIPTVKSYLVSIFSKLGVGSRTEAVFLSLRAGLITVDDIE